MVAFASGLPERLGAASCVSLLNEMVLVIIADEVLGWLVCQQTEEEHALWRRIDCSNIILK